MATTTKATSSSVGETNPPATDMSCLKNAVVVRENSIIGVFNGFASNMNNAHQTRLTDLSNSWEFSKGKLTVKEAWSKFKASSKEARKTWKESNKSAWTDFEKAAKLCKQNGGKGILEENEGKGIDMSVSN